MIFLSISLSKQKQKFIKCEKQCKYAKDILLSLKIVPPEMWKAQYWYWVGPSTNTEPSIF